MSDTALYRGISSSGIEDILENGTQAYKTKYDEARAVLSKYINPEILTDEFLEENKNYIGWLSYRFSQFTGGAGVFCLLEEKFSDEELNEKLSQIRDDLAKKGTSIDEINQLEASLRWGLKRQEEAPIQTARLYANTSTKEYPEYENYIVADLKNLKNDITECEESLKELGANSPAMKGDIERRLACKKILLENLKPQYRDVNGDVHIPKEKGNYPLILKIRGDVPFTTGNEQEVRLKGDLKAEDIIGVAFVPKNPEEQPTFLSKEEFLKQFQQRKKAKEKAMSDITLYRGVSSAGIEDILKNGVHPYKTKYDEARAVLSKYINPEILTDEFLEENQDNIGYAYGSLGFRFRQFQNDGGVFCTRDQFSEEDWKKKGIANSELKREFSGVYNAVKYAKQSTQDFPEYESFMVYDLNSLSNENLIESQEKIETDYMEGRLSGEEFEKQQKRIECRRKIFENIKPAYKDKNGQVHIVPEEGNYPVVLRINGNNREFSYSNRGEVRLAGDLKPEDITGIAFAPEKVDELPTFVSKEEFLKQLKQRKEKDRGQTETTNKDKISTSGGHLKSSLENRQTGKKMVNRNAFAKDISSSL